VEKIVVQPISPLISFHSRRALMKKAMMITILGVALIGMSSFVQAGEIKVQAEAAEEEAKGEVKAKVEEVKGKPRVAMRRKVNESENGGVPDHGIL